MSAGVPETPERLSRLDIIVTVIVSILVVGVLTMSLIGQLWTNALTVAGLGVVFAGLVIGAASTPKSQKSTPSYIAIGVLTLVGVVITGASLVVDQIVR